jgi:hypothetical protein
MMTATFLATLMIPMFFVVVSDKLSRRPAAADPVLQGGQ